MEPQAQNRRISGIRRPIETGIRRYRRPRTASAPEKAVLPARPAGTRPKHGRAAVVICIALLALLLAAVAGLVAVLWLQLGQPDASLSGSGDFFADDDEDDLPFDAYFEAEDEKEETTIAVYDTDGENFTLTLLDWAELEELSYEEVYAKCIPSVVSLTVTLSDGYSTGTGIVLSTSGYILTNEHVISGGSSASVLTWDDQNYDARLVGYDVQTDLAVLKIDAMGLQAASFGDSGLLAVGQSVLAIGDPLGPDLRGTLTEGIISALDRSVTTDGVTMTLLQTTAPLNSGNSGGPLINTCGLVVGVNNMKMSTDPTDPYTAPAEGLGFAIPSRTVKATVEALIRYGEVKHPALGITCYAVIAGVDGATVSGVMVDSVTAGSGAAAAGLAAGDIITAVEGQDISTVAEIKAVLEECQVGGFVILTVWRAGETLELSVELMDQNDM